MGVRRRGTGVRVKGGEALGGREGKLRKLTIFSVSRAPAKTKLFVLGYHFLEKFEYRI